MIFMSMRLCQEKQEIQTRMRLINFDDKFWLKTTREFFYI